MKAPRFRYVRPGRIEEVFELLQAHGDGARVLAGGQSLLATLNLRLSAPELLVDIGGLPLSGIRETPAGIEIGALTTHADVASSELVRRMLPLLHDAMPHVAHAAIRNRGTMGGSLALADPAAEWPALAVALRARIVLQGPRGRREVPAEQFFRGLYDTALDPGELVVAAAFERAAPDRRHFFEEVARRHGDYAAAGVAAIRDGSTQAPRLVLFGVGVKPVLLAARPAKGRAAVQEAVAEAVATQLEPQADVHFTAAAKRHLAGLLASRAVDALVAA